MGKRAAKAFGVKVVLVALMQGQALAQGALPDLGPRPAFSEGRGLEGLGEGAAAQVVQLKGLGLGLGLHLGLDEAPSALGLELGYGLGPIALGLAGGVWGSLGERLSWSWEAALALHMGKGQAFGVSYQLDQGGQALAGLTVHNVELSWLSEWSAHLRTVLALDYLTLPPLPALNGRQADPRLRLGLGLRPWGDSLSLNLEGQTHLGERPLAKAGAGLRWMPRAGWWLGVQGQVALSQREAQGDSVSVSLGFEQAGLRVLTQSEHAGRGELRQLGLRLGLSSEQTSELLSEGPMVLRVPVRGVFPERPSESFFGGRSQAFGDVLAQLAAVEQDPQVKGILLQIERGGSWAQAWELRRMVARLQAKGKTVVALLLASDMRAYYLASAADTVWLYAAGSLQLTGLAVTRTYLFGLMEQLGVRAEFIRFAEYKSAVEPFTRSGPSEEAAEVQHELLQGHIQAWLAAVSEGRKLSVEALHTILQEGPQDMHQALKLGLVDALVESDELGQALQRAFGKGRLIERYHRPVDGFSAWGASKRIAIVPVVGSIVDGASQAPSPLPIPFMGEASTGDRTLTRALSAAIADPDVAGIVLRVDSGGGSVTASDRLHRVIAKLQARKPIVVSFGDSAASGAYYLAAGSTIYATPLTLTGSIGVFTGKVDVSGLAERLGLSATTVKSHPRADMYSPWRGLTEVERAAGQSALAAYYERFLKVVQAGRKLPYEAVEQLARGRVWLGTSAYDKKLVDELAGLWDAVQAVAKAAGLNPQAPLEVTYFGTLLPLSDFQRVLGGALFDSAAPSLAPDTLYPTLEALGDALQLLSTGDVLALEPSLWRVQ